MIGLTKKEITDPIMALVAIKIGGKKRNFAESLLREGDNLIIVIWINSSVTSTMGIPRQHISSS